MTRFILAFALASISLSGNALAAAPGTTGGDAAASDSKPLPAWIEFLESTKPYVGIAFLVLLIAAIVTIVVQAMLAPPLTPAERKAAEEQMLDLMSEMRVRSAAAGWSNESFDTALHDEMKLVELRRIRRLQE